MVSSEKGGLLRRGFQAVGHPSCEGPAVHSRQATGKVDGGTLGDSRGVILAAVGHIGQGAGLGLGGAGGQDGGVDGAAHGAGDFLEHVNDVGGACHAEAGSGEAQMTSGIIGTVHIEAVSVGRKAHGAGVVASVPIIESIVCEARGIELQRVAGIRVLSEVDAVAAAYHSPEHAAGIRHNPVVQGQSGGVGAGGGRMVQSVVGIPALTGQDHGFTRGGGGIAELVAAGHVAGVGVEGLEGNVVGGSVGAGEDVGRLLRYVVHVVQDPTQEGIAAVGHVGGGQGDGIALGRAHGRGRGDALGGAEADGPAGGGPIDHGGVIGGAGFLLRPEGNAGDGGAVEAEEISRTVSGALQVRKIGVRGAGGIPGAHSGGGIGQRPSAIVSKGTGGIQRSTAARIEVGVGAAVFDGVIAAGAIGSHSKHILRADVLQLVLGGVEGNAGIRKGNTSAGCTALIRCVGSQTRHDSVMVAAGAAASAGDDVVAAPIGGSRGEKLINLLAAAHQVGVQGLQGDIALRLIAFVGLVNRFGGGGAFVHGVHHPAGEGIALGSVGGGQGDGITNDAGNRAHRGHIGGHGEGHGIAADVGGIIGGIIARFLPQADQRGVLSIGTA